MYNLQCTTSNLRINRLTTNQQQITISVCVVPLKQTAKCLQLANVR